MAKRKVLGRRTIKLDGHHFRFELRADGIHVRKHKSRTHAVLSFYWLELFSRDKNVAKIMTTRKRYATEAEIQAAIDEARKQATALLKEAEGYINMAHHFAAKGSQPDAKDCLQKADAAKKKATSLLDGRCEKLKQKLAILQTPMFPCMVGDDASIPAS